MKRLITLLLAVLMCASALFGCSKEEDKESETLNINLDEIDDGIGEYDFEGADFTILTRKETNYEHLGDMAGDSVSQKVYERNQTVMERFNVNIKTVEMIGDYEQREAFITALRAENMSPTGAYDLVSTHNVYLGWTGVEGIAADLTKLPEIDLTKDYWNQNLYNELNINGACYMMIGDIAHTLYEYISVMFVNTNVLTNNNIIEGGMDGLYNLVEEGKWTWGTVYEMSKDYGIGQEDTYGLVMNIHAMRAAFIAQDAYIYDRDESTGLLYMKDAADEHLINAVQNLSKFFARENSYFTKDWGTGSTDLNPIFADGKTLFYPQTLGESKAFMETMGGGYSVLPLPKFDEFQSDYYTITADNVTGVMVMTSTKDKTMSGVITQALCMYGQQLVTPEYYERVLKYRYNDDPRSVEMLDKIRDSLTIQPVGTYYDTGIDSDMFRDIVMLGEMEGIASRYAEYPTRANNELQTFYAQIEMLQEE